ncbi:hypothetical protein GCM10010446_25240 [Streptomyces enissocaesilis]|uniref:Uncharacterized protein n=2 Tax=Streptomyces enissocaesilis TaxID=332589 RepID=A0ABP6JR69_9ACTN
MVDQAVRRLAASLVDPGGEQGEAGHCSDGQVERAWSRMSPRLGSRGCRAGVPPHWSGSTGYPVPMGTEEDRLPPTDVPALINEIVQAVRDGDDPRIRTLLERLAQRADTEALLLLRARLDEDLSPER